MITTISRVEVIDRLLAPAETELWIRLHTASPMPDAEVTGRIVGPRCRYAETVEIAYKLRPLPAHLVAETADRPTARVILPEACFWEPVSPFLYHGVVELHREGKFVEGIVCRHGLRQVRIGERFLLNGRELTLRCHSCKSLDQERAGWLHQEGFNVLIVPVEQGTESIWSLADEVGFFVLGEVRTWNASVEAMLRRRADHPSCVAWLVSKHVRGAADEIRKHATHQVGVREGENLDGMDFRAKIEDDVLRFVRVSG